MCSGSWARFENEATYWNAGQRAYCPGPPRGTFLQISVSCTFHDNVLSVAVIVVSVANLFVHRISTEELHNPHAQKFLLSVANHICICCLCDCSGAHYYRIALYPMHHISMYPWVFVLERIERFWHLCNSLYTLGCSTHLPTFAYFSLFITTINDGNIYIEYHMDFLPKTANLQGGDTRQTPKNTQFSTSRQTY